MTQELSMRRENPSKQRLVLGQYRGLVSVISGPAVGGHLESRNALEVHHLQHLLGLGVNLDDVLLQLGHVGDVVVSPLTLLLLQLDGDASHGAALESLHQVSDEPGNLVAERLGGNEGNLLNDPLVGVEIEGKLGVVLLDDDPGSLLDGFGSDATHDGERIFSCRSESSN